MPEINQIETYDFYTDPAIGVSSEKIEQASVTEVVHYYQNTTFGEAISKDPEFSGFNTEFDYDWATKGTLLKFNQME